MLDCSHLLLLLITNVTEAGNFKDKMQEEAYYNYSQNRTARLPKPGLLGHITLNSFICIVIHGVWIAVHGLGWCLG